MCPGNKIHKKNSLKRFRNTLMIPVSNFNSIWHVAFKVISWIVRLVG